MRDLAARLAALDPDAGAALSVIAYFDRLVEARAGLQAIVRGAAVLAGCPARLADDGRRVHLRVQPDGTDAPAGPPDPAWMSAEAGGGAVLWLERAGTPNAVEAMVLERAAGAARGVLDRTRGRAAADPASIELTLDPDAPEQVRLQAAGRLGFKNHDFVRAVAPVSGPALVVAGSAPVPSGRAGIGPVGPVLALPASYAAARTALRFTAEGTERDPGPRIVHADELGGLILLAEVTGPGTEPLPDVRALEAVAASAPWALATLDAVASAASLRAAAGVLRLHHSTLQDRLGQLIHLLGWDVRAVSGRLRLQVALALRRLHR